MHIFVYDFVFSLALLVPQKFSVRALGAIQCEGREWMKQKW